MQQHQTPVEGLARTQMRLVAGLKPMLRGWAAPEIETESEGCVPYVAKDLVILRRSAGGQNGLMFFVEVIQDLGNEDFTRTDQRPQEALQGRVEAEYFHARDAVFLRQRPSLLAYDR